MLVTIYLGIIHLVWTQNFQKSITSNPLARRPTCAYQGVRNVIKTCNLFAWKKETAD